MQPRPPLARGAVDNLVGLPDGSLGIGGWYAPFEPVTVDGMQVRATTGPVVVLGAANAPSADIAALHPRLANTARCRFELRVETSDALRQPNTLLELRPQLSSGAAGLPLYALANLDLPIPEDAAVHAIGGGFLGPALEFMRFFAALAGLQRDHTVLDIGCGIGRMAYPLVAYFGPSGRYLGFDVMRDAIATARRCLGHDRRFVFEHLDLDNPVYNPKGRIDSRSVRLPCTDGSIDLGVMTSVATHLLAGEVQHYFAELGRCLRRGGRALVTAFCMTEEAQALVVAGHGTQRFIPSDGCWVVDPQFPAKSIAFRREDLVAWFAAAGLRVQQWYGGDWCGRAAGLTYQDVFIVEH